MTTIETTAAAEPLYDLLVIGGGINGAGFARDAAGRGLSVALCEKDDLAQGTSSRSGKLVHGGLRYLEYYEFRLVREALRERSVLLKKAPHIIWPMRFVLPHSPEQRPAWLVRCGLFLYDHLGGRDDLLPGSRGLNLLRCPEGEPVKDDFPRGFEYADCWVDDARLVVLNALDAQRLGAVIHTRQACTSAIRHQDHWQVEMTNTDSGEITTIKARALINAAGPWVDKVLKGAFGEQGKDRVRLVKGSHIVLPKRYATANSYLLQNDDKRVIFVNPYEGDKLLVGTTDIVYEGEPDDVAIDDNEINYLLGVVNRYFKQPYDRDDILTSFSGIRPLFDDSRENPSAVTRDYVFDIQDDDGKAPLLSVFGGKITTYRKLAEHGLEKLQPWFPQMTASWNETAPLPGGDMPNADFEVFLDQLWEEYPWLEDATATRYARLYGTIAREILGNAGSYTDLGEHLGADLYAAEARYLVEQEWARRAEDILERRTKLYLVMSEAEVAAVEAWLMREYVDQSLARGVENVVG
ncbi:glycerol-3-phosphate dehydrogenase [Halomonas cupida]|uniref:Glycerol-3-phosphate dehydrogenase n=1 Tax=Halomonas cupida TaxID=44933 RepID=A0A1M7IK66_9GAMM|nr:glycerol-3-phosphate dehydrogenase [Halomonas cupida]GEN24091.1 glycerol-3-phosphate dehydrogenase [Halomonas cupida]SHM41069.1 glycerol-3-phosphate dehydrogenase [Halomonas cupida]